MSVAVVFLVIFVPCAFCSVEIHTPRNVPYVAQKTYFYYRTGNYTVGTKDDFGLFQIMEMHLKRDVWVILFKKPDADKIPGKNPCSADLDKIPQKRIMKIYNNHTVLESTDTPDKWSIETNTAVCFLVLKMESSKEWGSFRYKYEDTCRKNVVIESRDLFDSTTLILRSYERCYPARSTYATVVDFQMTLKNETSLDRVMVTTEKSYHQMECKYVMRLRYDRYYGYVRNKQVRECIHLMITGQTPPGFLRSRWPLVLTNTPYVCFRYEAIMALTFKDDVRFKVSEFPECNGTVTNRTGIITSPGYPLKPYDNRTSCAWTIKVRPGEKIAVKFGPTVSDCDNDYIMLSNVTSGSDNQELLCGNTVTGRSFMSNSHQMSINFSTNVFKNLKGFQMNYTVVGCSLLDVSFPSQSMMLNKPKGYIPSGYGLRVGCNPGFVFPSKVAEVKLECLPNGTWKGNIPYCIAYSVCNKTLIAVSGDVTSPGYPHPYPKDASCSWTLKAKVGQHIHIRIEDIKSFCENDYIILKGVEAAKTKTLPPATTTTNSTSLAGKNPTASINATRSRRSIQGQHQKQVFCGGAISSGDEFYSFDHQVEITFRSNIFQENGYFKMSHKTIGCSTDDIRMPPNVVIRNPTNFYPVNFRLIIACKGGFKFPSGAGSLFLKCGNDLNWIGKIPFCVGGTIGTILTRYYRFYGRHRAWPIIFVWFYNGLLVPTARLYLYTCRFGSKRTFHFDLHEGYSPCSTADNQDTADCSNDCPKTATTRLWNENKARNSSAINLR